MSETIRLAFVFARVGVMTFGGGYAMLPLLSRELVEKRAWLTEPEFADMTAVGQCTPGIIGVNMATYAGYKRAGVRGGVAATLGLVFPSAVIIALVAALLRGFADVPAVRHAFTGIRVAVCALVVKTAVSLLKSSVFGSSGGLRRVVPAVVFAAALALALFTNLHPAVLALASGAFGIAYSRLRAGK
ncbi:MAG: chromate transporter [Oscillospiraceae bacterium]|jgi:chromate transporter|nr:chromate transporter [Oscillospiraceae bacterium]